MRKLLIFIITFVTTIPCLGGIKLPEIICDYDAVIERPTHILFTTMKLRGLLYDNGETIPSYDHRVYGVDFSIGIKEAGLDKSLNREKINNVEIPGCKKTGKMLEWN
jgi:hypothetical protein